MTETIICREPAWGIQLDTITPFEPVLAPPPCDAAAEVPPCHRDPRSALRPPVPPPEEFWSGREVYPMPDGSRFRWKDDHSPPCGVTGRWVLVSGPPTTRRKP